MGIQNAYLAITGIQLELGSVATPFETLSFETELRQCQRYLETNFDYGTAPANGVISLQYMGSAYNFGANTRIVTSIPFQVTKRIPPTVYAYGSSTNSASGYWSYYNNLSNWEITTAYSTPSVGTKSFNFSLDGINQSNVTVRGAYIVSGGWLADADY
jgi:hypothetical protein